MDSNPWIDYKGNINSVIIEYGVENIIEQAFTNCYSLTSVSIPESVNSIGNMAFSGCFTLTSITIPNNVTSFGHFSFFNCSSLISITIPGSVTSIENEAFSNCSNLKLVKFNGILDPEHGKNIFSYTPLKYVFVTVQYLNRKFCELPVKRLDYTKNHQYHMNYYKNILF